VTLLKQKNKIIDLHFNKKKPGTMSLAEGKKNE
jgi:hypothetical protein